MGPRKSLTERFLLWVWSMIPFTLGNKATLQQYRKDKTDLIVAQYEKNDLQQKNDRLQQQIEGAKKFQEELYREHALLRSEIMGEARVTMRSIRRANALIGLFFFTLIVLLILAIIGRR